MAPWTAKRVGHGKISTPSVRKANAAGFAKRRSRSVKAAAGLSDVYDYEAVKSKRGNVAMLLDKDEEAGAGHDEGEDDNETGRRKPRFIGEGEDDERIGSDEDEEIDSDDAFEESDEERYAGFGFKKKGNVAKSKPAPKRSGKNVHFAEVDLDENHDMEADNSEAGEENAQGSDDEEEEEGEGDEFIDVLDVLDGRGEVDPGEDSAPEKHKKATSDAKKLPVKRLSPEDHEGGDDGIVDEEEDDDDEDQGDSDEEIAISGSDEDEADTSALDQLNSFVSGLETGTKRKASEEEDESTAAPIQSKKKRLLRDRTEAGVENEFGARATGSTKLSLDDLLTPLVSQAGALSTLKKSMKPLVASSDPKSQSLSAPLPTRTQEKLDREAAYEQTKKEVDKWDETMKRIREAEHISFPLQTPKTVKMSNLELTAKFKPETELESSIDRLLKSAKLREEDISKTEDLMMKDLSAEEVAERRAELRKMRELMFRTEVKAKRVAKIKSKAYRRIQKKEREKLMSKLDASADVAEVSEEARMKAELDRARERATLKHKNTGKWAKAMKARGELDTDQRRDINEMLERGDRLRRRIQGEGSESEDLGEGDSSDDELEGGDGITKVKMNAFDELDKLQKDADGAEPDGKHGAKSVFEMKFMKDAAARHNRDIDKTIDDFRKEMGDAREDNDDEDAQADQEEPSTSIERVNGRMVFRPGPQTPTNSNLLPPPPPSAISETSTLKSHDSLVLSPVSDRTAHGTSTIFSPPHSIPAPAAEEPNPWLSIPESSSSKLAKRKNEIIVGKDSNLAQKSEVALKKQMKKTAEEREKEKDDAVLEISTEDALVLGTTNPQDATLGGAGASGGKKKKEKKKKQKKDKGKEKASPEEDGDDSDANSELEEQEATLTRRKGAKAFEQRDLVARAFAGDNVVRQFEEAKRKELESDAPREVDTTLPGWGSWGGSGTSKAPPKPYLIKKVAGIDPKSRADYGKARVIISEKRDKKASKYTVRDLPYPYTSKAQFEASMDIPLGTEWNTRLGFQRGTLPRVVKKMGTVIDPLEKLL